MFDIGWSEMAVVVVIALLVLGPKQLPEALRTITQFTRKARRYAQEFRSGIDNIVREAELEEARQALSSVKSANPTKAISDLIDPTGEMSKEMKDLEETAKKETDPSKPSSAPAKSSSAAADDGKTGDGDAGEEVQTSKIVTTPPSIAPGNSIRPPAGPDIFRATPPATEAAVPAEKDDATPAPATETANVKTDGAGKAETSSDATEGDSAENEPAKEDERRQV